MARALRSRGHEVAIATHVDYRQFVEATGARLIELPPSLADAGSEDEWQNRVNHPRTGTEFVVRKLVLPYVEESYVRLKRVVPDFDLILSHVLTLATPIAADEAGVPWLSVALQPGVFLSLTDPPALAAAPFMPRLPKLGVRFFYGLIRTVMRQWFAPVQQIRKRAGLPPGPNPILDGFSPRGTLALFPAEFAVPQPDWPANVRQVGFPLFDTETTSQASAGLERFLSSGPPPVTFTLGSSVVRTTSGFFGEAFRAVKSLGVRAVFLAGVQQDAVEALTGGDSEIFVGGYEPFSALFPRSSAIVHQCGIGTTAQALASGRPQVLVPFAHDQPDNARRVANIGCGIVLPSNVSADRLAAALRQLRSGSYAKRAADFRKLFPHDSFDQRLYTAVNDLSQNAVSRRLNKSRVD